MARRAAPPRRKPLDPGGANREERIPVLVTPELKAAIKAAAARDGDSVSNWIQRLIRRELETATR